MKTIKFLPLLLLLLISACSPVRVAADYEKKTDFSQYKTYAFYKTGIDKVEISDLDKRRILRSLEESMNAKGFTKSETPDLLVNFFTHAQKEIYVDSYYGGYGYWGWGPYWGPYWGGYPYVYTDIEGTLFIDLIDTKKNELVWQGEGSGTLTENSGDKDERIKEFVDKIMEQYPPKKKK